MLMKKVPNHPKRSVVDQLERHQQHQKEENVPEGLKHPKKLKSKRRFNSLNIKKLNKFTKRRNLSKLK